jgi:hypothetical protein
MSVEVLVLPVLLAHALGLAFGIVIIVGAVKMMRLNSHGFATVASVLALLPCGPAWLLGLPMGIWSLLVLGRQDVKAAFRATQPKAAPPPFPVVPSPEAGKLMLQAPADALILAGSAALLTALGVGLWLWLKWNEAFLSELDKGNLVGMSVGNAVYALIIIMTGVLMRRLRGRLFALVCVVIVGLFFPAVVALNVVMELKNIPQWPVVIPTWLGVPLAIWATVTLFRRDVRAAFQVRTKSREPPARPTPVIPGASGWSR